MGKGPGRSRTVLDQAAADAPNGATDLKCQKSQPPDLISKPPVLPLQGQLVPSGLRKPQQPFENRALERDPLPPPACTKFFAWQHPGKKPTAVRSSEALESAIHPDEDTFCQLALRGWSLIKRARQAISEVEGTHEVVFGPRRRVIPAEPRLKLESVDVRGPTRREVSQRRAATFGLDDRARLQRGKLICVQPGQERS